MSSLNVVVRGIVGASLLWTLLGAVPAWAAPGDAAPPPEGLSPDAWAKLQHRVREAEGALKAGTLSQEKKLTASDPGNGDSFGNRVAVSGDTAVVGAYLNDVFFINPGAAYVFERNLGGPDNWGEVKRLLADDRTNYDWFGYSVAISDDTIVVGAWLDDTSGGGDSGSAYVFERDAGGPDNWGQVEHLVAADAAAGDRFGESVAVSGTTIVVGAPYDDDMGLDSGAAYLFARDGGGTWAEVKKLTATDAAAQDRFGVSVAVSDTTTVVGAYLDDDGGNESGAAYVFERDSGGANNWGQVSKLTAADAAAVDWFGISVAISGTTAVVGAYQDDDVAENSGSAYVFERDAGGVGNWGQVSKLKADDAGAGDGFGASVAVSGTTAVVGAHLDDGVEPDSGSAYIFERDVGGVDNWGQVSKLTADDAANGDNFGVSVAVSDGTFMVGANGKDDVGSNSGAAYVFYYAADLWVSVTDGLAAVSPGAAVTYVISAGNDGTRTDGAATLTDDFPPALTCGSWTSEAAGGATGNTAAGTGNLSETLSLPPGSSVTYTVGCTVDGAATGILANTATVTASVVDSDPADNTATDTTDLDPKPDFVVRDLELSTRSPRPGEPLRLSYNVVNQGTDVGPAGHLEEVYLSTDPSLDVGDTLLTTSDPHPALLANGGSFTNVEVVVVPALETPGIRYVLVKADAGDAAAELDEDNNAAVAQLAVVHENPVYWQTAGFLGTGRRGHTATLLLSGKLLVTGGDDGAPSVAAELFDPATGEWTATAPMGTPRHEHTATLLPSGKVLVTGGEDAGGTLRAAELYDPRTGTWTSTALLNDARRGHTATLLLSGKVLVAGGRDNEGRALASSELYDPDPDTDPATDDSTWTIGVGMEARYQHTASLLRNGKVLVAGGNDGSADLDSVQLFDPAAGWVSAFSLVYARAEHTATVLGSGKVLVVGGHDGLETETFDPGTGSWTPESPVRTARRGHAATLLASGKVVVTGGRNADGELLVTEIYNPDAAGGPDWRITGSLDTQRSGHTATLLPSGKVVVTGGLFRPYGFLSALNLADTEVFDPAAGTWQPPADLGGPHVRHAATLLPDGKVLLTGDGDEVYDPAAGTWTADSSGVARKHHSATTLASGDVLVAGGQGDAGPLADVRLYRGNAWTATASLHEARSRHAAVRLLSGKVLVAGGRGTGAVSLGSSELFDPDPDGDPATGDGAWTSLPGGGLGTPRESATVTLLASGRVLLTGGMGDGKILASAELYDPVTETWTETSPLAVPRLGHAATLLASGRVLVAGGRSGSSFASAEVYDPVLGRWESTGSLSLRRYDHTATLLPGGQVLVVGGLGDEHSLSSAEVYEPATGAWRDGGFLTDARYGHSATLLASGALLVAGGEGAPPTSELYEPDAPGGSRTVPQVTGALSTLTYEPATPAEVFEVTGNLRGDSETGSGTTASSSAVHPAVRLRSLDGSRYAWLEADPQPDFSTDPRTLTFSELPPGLRPGPHLLTVSVAGVPSTTPVSSPSLVNVACSLGDPVILGTNGEIPDGTFVDVPLDGRAVLRARAHGALRFQWLRDGVEVDGAVGPVLETPRAKAEDSGARYSVRVTSGCAEKLSGQARLRVLDTQAPTVRVVAPNGGEVVIRGLAGQSVSWAMDDDIRICEVGVDLLVSQDGGLNFDTVLPVLELPSTPPPSGNEVLCDLAGEVRTTSLFHDFDVPAEHRDKLYKVRVTVRDGAGLSSVDESDKPFYVFEARDDEVRTLVVWNRERMRSIGGETDAELDALSDRLDALAADQYRVLGKVVDLGTVPELEARYDAWDAAMAEVPLDRDLVAQRANEVLFGVDNGEAEGVAQVEFGVEDYLREQWFSRFPKVEYLVLAGDDRFLPMARMFDQTLGVGETRYTQPDPDDPSSQDMTPDNTTVGMALAAGYFLSDDPLTTALKKDSQGREPASLLPGDLKLYKFVPEVAAGRLVETPAEIRSSINTFLAHRGTVTLSGANDVLVSGYDFLVDGAESIRRTWESTFSDNGVPYVDVNSLIYDDEWAAGAAREQTLQDLLCAPHAVTSLNGHASHYEVGVPAGDWYEILGLDASEVEAAHQAGNCDLSGKVIYEVGCHSGLSVAGSTAAGDGDHALDLPQALLRAGATAYLGNTGYGWGLTAAVGYSERLVREFTAALAAAASENGEVSLGQAFLEAKAAYLAGTERYDVYDDKVLNEWTFFGFPMTVVDVTGLPAPASTTAERKVRRPFRDPPPKLAELAETERFGPVTVERYVPRGTTLEGATMVTPPSFLTRVEVTFDFSADGVYRLFDRAGRDVPHDDLVPRPGGGDYCRLSAPDPVGLDKGCSFGLNASDEGRGDLQTSMTDRPVHPMFVYDSRLSGTSFHGYVLKGETYRQVDDWVPVFSQLASNLDDESYFVDRGDTDEDPKELPGGAPDTPNKPNGCEASDENATSLVAVTGQLLKSPCPSGGACDPARPFDTERLSELVTVETFYYNNTTREEDTLNCDRTGPRLPAVTGCAFGETVPEGEICAFAGSKVRWAVHGVCDPDLDPNVNLCHPDEVWRVLVLYDDNKLDANGRGSWRSFELEDPDGNGVWTHPAGRPLEVAGVDRLTYVLQAVDKRGNVRVQRFNPIDPQAGAGTAARKAADGALPSSGVPQDYVRTVDVDFTVGDVDLAVTLAGPAGDVNALSPVAYTVDVLNYGPDAANRVEVELAVPLLEVAVTGDGWDCGETAPGTWTCVRDSLGLLQAPRIAVFGTAPGVAGTLTVTAALSTLSSDTVAANDLAAVSNTVLAIPTSDLRIAQDVDFAADGRSPVYTVTVTNSGPDGVDGARVLDIFPAALGNVTWTCSAPDPSSSCAAGGAGHVDDNVDVGPSQAVTYVVTTTLPAGYADLLVNTATVIPPIGTWDPDADSNSATTAIDYVTIFRDGFESGNVDAWSTAVGN